MYSTLYCFPVLIKLEFSGQNFEKSSNVKFDENPSSQSRVVPCRQTDRHDEANSHFSQFCEKAPKTGIMYRKGVNYNLESSNELLLL